MAQGPHGANFQYHKEPNVLLALILLLCFLIPGIVYILPASGMGRTAVVGAPVLQLPAHLGIARVTEPSGQHMMVSEHGFERIDTQVKLGGAEMDVTHALAKDTLVDTQHRPDPLPRGVLIEQVP